MSTAVCPPPQGSVESVLGPLLYTLYTADFTYVVERHGICLHQYADDSQVYVSVPVSDVTTAITETCSLRQFDNAASRLRLNPMKTEVMWLGARSAG